MANTRMDEIKKMFAERIGSQKIDESKSLKDLGLDSLDVVKMCLPQWEKESNRPLRSFS